MPESSKWIFRNASRRPVELHLKSGVVVMPPRGTIELSEPERHCLALEKRGVLTRHPAPKEAPEPGARKSDRKSAGSAASVKSGRGGKRGKSTKRSKSDRTGSESAGESGETAKSGKSESRSGKKTSSSVKQSLETRDGDSA